jgi:hypothetical protein
MVGDLCPPKGVKGSFFYSGKRKMCSVAVYPPLADKSATKNKQIFMGENSNEKVNNNLCSSSNDFST